MYNISYYYKIGLRIYIFFLYLFLKVLTPKKLLYPIIQKCECILETVRNINTMRYFSAFLIFIKNKFRNHNDILTNVTKYIQIILTKYSNICITFYNSQFHSLTFKLSFDT